MRLNDLLCAARHGAVLAGVLVMSSCALETAEDPAAGEDAITSNTEQAVDIALTAIGSTLVSGDFMCLDVHYPDRVTNGGRVQIWECHGGINQLWRFEGNMLASGNGMCLDVHYPDRVTNGGRVQIWECHGGINQQWHFEGNMLVSGNGMCLDVHHPDRVTNGGRVQIWECHGGKNQQWHL